MKRSRIIVRDLVKTFRDGGREVAAVQGASFDILYGEFVAIVGPSGCGKSTILTMIGGLVTSTAGAVDKQIEKRLLRWRPEYRDRT